MYFMLLFVLLIFSIRMENDALLAFDFFLSAAFLVALVQTHYNLVGINITSIDVPGCFAGDTTMARVTVQNIARRKRSWLQLDLGLEHHQSAVFIANVLPAGSGTTKPSWAALRRGCYRIPNLRLSTTYPFGLFRSWTWHESAHEHDVYPAPRGSRSLPHDAGGNRDNNSVKLTGRDDFYGHREYHPGDSLRHVNWKARARGAPLLTKIFRSESGGCIMLTWDDTDGNADVEIRLSQLALWLVTANAKGFDVGLTLPGNEIPPGAGPAHHQKCLHALATFGAPS